MQKTLDFHELSRISANQILIRLLLILSLKIAELPELHVMYANSIFFCILKDYLKNAFLPFTAQNINICKKKYIEDVFKLIFFPVFNSKCFRYLIFKSFLQVVKWNMGLSVEFARGRVHIQFSLNQLQLGLE